MDIDEIAKMKRLKCLIMKGNPVCAVENYRAYCIYKLNDGLKMLDYLTHSRMKEREQAKKMFGEDDGKAVKAKTFTVGKRGGRDDDEEEEDEAKKTKEKPKNNAAELAKIKAAIANATTLEEIAMLEKAMETGKMPSEYNK